jgi:hypothetical protein
VGALVFVLCCAADAFVVHTAWTGTQVVEGQFRRGYFERFDQIGLALDEVIRPVFPSFELTDDGALAVPPGATAVSALVPRTTYGLARDGELAPYIVIGAEVPVAPREEYARQRLLPGEARLVDARTLSLEDGHLTLSAWDAGRPWRDDAARLSALYASCVVVGQSAALSVSTTADQLEIHLGRCALAVPLPLGSDGPLLLAALAGPEWLTVTRQPGWVAERWFVWPVLAAVAMKVALVWWGLGVASTVAASALLAPVALWMPVPAMLTWPLLLIVGVLASAFQGAAIVFRRLPSRWRAPVGLVLVALAGCAVTLKGGERESFPPIARDHSTDDRPDACAIIGYSTAGGASLRGASLHRGHDGIRSLLDENCAPCRQRAASLSAGGETLGWARDAYCASDPSFGKNGQVIFFGAANDDYLWGVAAVARMFIVGQQGVQPWRSHQGPAMSASMDHIDEQVSALQGLMQCASARDARFLFLHDFLVTDLVAGREPEREAMLERRRRAVEAAGGTFVDLYRTFAPEAGIAWFNDYVHPSLVADERIADLVCRQYE